LNYLDIILAIPLLWAIYKGFRKGLIIEIASLVALLLGIYGSIHFSDYVSDYLKNSFHMKTAYLHIISFAVTFILIVIIVYAIAWVIEKLVDVVSLSFVNKLAGSVFSLIKMAFILSVILYFIDALDTKKSFISESKRNSSVLYIPVSNLAKTFVPSINNIKLIEKGQMLIDNAKSKF
jgi:membrane protein required for colicin V production